MNVADVIAIVSAVVASVSLVFARRARAEAHMLSVLVEALKSSNEADNITMQNSSQLITNLQGEINRLREIISAQRKEIEEIRARLYATQEALAKAQARLAAIERDVNGNGAEKKQGAA